MFLDISDLLFGFVYLMDYLYQLGLLLLLRLGFRVVAPARRRRRLLR